MSLSVDSHCWPADRIADGISLLLSMLDTQVIRSGSKGRQTQLPDHSRSLDLDYMGEEVLRTCASFGITPLPLSSGLDHLADCLSSTTPLVVSLHNGQSALLILKASPRHALILAPDGQKLRLKLKDLLHVLQPPVPSEIAGSIDALKDRLSERSIRKLTALHRRHRPIFVGWKLPVSRGGVSFTSQLLRSFAARTVALLSLHLVYFTLWVASWVALVNMLAGTGDSQTLTVFWVLALMSSMLALPVESWLIQDIATRAGVMVKRRLLNHALGMDKSAVRQRGIGQLIARTLDANQLDSLASRGGVRVLLSVFDTLLILVLVYLYTGADPLLLLFIGMIALLVWRSIACYQSELRLHTAHLAVTALHTEEMIGHRTRKIFIGRSAWHTQESALLAGYDRACAEADAMSQKLSTVPRMWGALGTATVLGQIYLQNAGGFDSVVLVGFVIIGAATLANVTIGIGPLLRALVVIRHLDLNNIGDVSNPAIADPGIDLQPDSEDGSSLKVQGLRFRYPSAAEAIVGDVDLTVVGNAKILLSGASGSGKSTIGALLAGRLQASAGTIISQGVDRHVVGRLGWLKHVAYVPQANDNHVLTDTFAFNLLLGRAWPPSTTDLQQAEALATALGLGPLLAKMPAGMMQMVGEGGWRLSQGERSRLFVARGILQNPHVLIADELLSPLDPASSLEVLAAIEQLPNSLILIAHT